MDSHFDFFNEIDQFSEKIDGCQIKLSLKKIKIE